ncbi:MAG: DUF192 domain-containing protein [Desulfobacteraceae bacterium]|jgi:uncharacterized membrane protein (UPF0127 family)
MNSQRTIFFLSFILLFFVVKGICFANDICGYNEMGTVEIVRDIEIIGKYHVTLAETAQSRQRGLMYCPELSKGTGMLFLFPNVKRWTFWMKNTYIELAIIFITKDGKIAAIERGEPESLARIQSPDNIQSVLEINYNESRDLKVGDQVNLRLNSDSGNN